MQGVLAVEADFRVVDESPDWIVVDKAAPLVVHPTGKKAEPTLLGGLQALLAYEIANGVRLSIINRLDRETSGLVLVAKHAEAARWFNKRMESRAVSKGYEALVCGWPVDDEWVADGPLLGARELGETAIGVRQVVHPAGRPARTEFAVMSRFSHHGERFARIGCRPVSGRMHQIRVHLAAAGHPVVGDKIYTGAGEAYLEFVQSGWSEAMGKRMWLRRHALHSTELAFEDVEGQSFRWQSGLPADLLEFELSGESR